MATKSISIGYSANTLSTQAQSVVTITGRTVYGRVVSATTAVVQAAVAVNPSIQWVNSTMSAPAYRSGNWEGENPVISPAFTYNDITAITVSVVTGNSYVQSTYLSTGSTNTVDVELKLNKNTSLTPQIVVRLTGIGRDGLTYTDDLLITQDAGVDPHIDIDGQRGGTAYTFNANYTGSTGGYFNLSWAYVKGNDIEIGRNGNVTSVTIGQSSASGYEFDIAMLSNTAQTQVVSTVSFTGTTVYGDDIVATLTITQNGAVVPTTSFTWNYQVHFAGLPQAERLFIHFDLRDSSNNLLAYAELDDDSSSYDDSIANQWFSGTTTVTVPTTVNLNNLNVENSPTFTGSYYSKNLSGNVFTSILTVPSPGSGITISQVLAQAYSDASGVSTFPYKVTLQSLSGEDQTPVYDTGVTTSTTVTNTINNVRPVSATASTQYSNQVITDFKTRMGYYLGITVDTGLTGNFALLKAMIESQTINLYEIPVSGSNGNYVLYLGGTSLDWNQATIYLKFIDTTPGTGVTYNLGSVGYTVTRGNAKSEIDTIYMQTFDVTYTYPDGSDRYGIFSADYKKMENITGETTTSSTTWNVNSFTAPSGSTMTGRLSIRSQHAAITGAQIQGFNNLGSRSGTLNSELTRANEGWYVFDFILGTLPSSSTLANSTTIRVNTDPYYDVRIQYAVPNIKVINSTSNQVYVSVSMYATHYGLASDSVLCLSTSNQQVNGGGTTTISATRQIPDGASMIPNIQKVWCTWNISGAPAGTHAEITITGLSNKIETPTTQMEPLTSHMVLSSADDFILTITT